MDKESFSTLIADISTLSADERKEKLYAAISQLKTNESLEDVGRLMTPPLFSSLMEFEEASIFLKPILVGMPAVIFTSYLENSDIQSLKNLKQEAVSEPLLHQLTSAKFYVIAKLEELFKTQEELKLEIFNMHIEELTSSELASLYERLDALYDRVVSVSKLLSNMLLLAWNSKNSDLIEKLSLLKENASKFLNVDVGIKDAVPTGLFYLLQSKLDSAFQKEDSLGNKVKLEDSYPALEGLSCFSVWYIQDYKRIGLINGEDEKEKSEADLYLLAKEGLEAAGLSTIADFKQKGIYSLKMLQDFLKSS